MTIPGDAGAMPGWLNGLPEKPRARLEATIRELRARFPYPGTRFPIEDAALGRFRCEDAAGAQEQYREGRSLLAGHQWRTVRALEVEEQASKLMSRPAATVRLLESSWPGIRWLLEKWGWLVLALEKLGAWDEALQRQAQRLCGVPAAYESVDPRLVRDGSLEQRLALARGEIARLEALLTPEMEVSDAADRQAAIDGTDVPDDATYRRLARREREARRFHDRAMADLGRIRERIEAEAEAAAVEVVAVAVADQPSAETGRTAPQLAGKKAGRRGRGKAAPRARRRQ